MEGVSEVCLPMMGPFSCWSPWLSTGLQSTNWLGGSTLSGIPARVPHLPLYPGQLLHTWTALNSKWLSGAGWVCLTASSAQVADDRGSQPDGRPQLFSTSPVRAVLGLLPQPTVLSTLASQLHLPQACTVRQFAPGLPRHSKHPKGELQDLHD